MPPEVGLCLQSTAHPRYDTDPDAQWRGRPARAQRTHARALGDRGETRREEDPWWCRVQDWLGTSEIYGI